MSHSPSNAIFGCSCPMLVVRRTDPRWYFVTFCLLVGLLLSGSCVTSSIAQDHPANSEQAEARRPTTDVRDNVRSDVRSHVVRVATCQAQGRTIDWRLNAADDVLAVVDRNIEALTQIIQQAGEKKCDVLAFPEDTLGLLHWYGANEELAKQILPVAVRRMLEKLGQAAAAENMYLVVCSDHFETNGKLFNTAFFLRRDGQEIGRYHKVSPTWSESGSRGQGTEFPVFETTDLGNVGLAICYDLVMPETARCLALQGADIVFFPTMGGAAIGDDDIGLQALRVRAAENQVYLAVAFRGSGAMIISPKGKILAQADAPDGLAIADIDPFSGRDGGDSSNFQPDMRARLFRERNAAAYSILTNPNPPALNKIPPPTLTREAAGTIFARMLTVGEQQYSEAQTLLAAGNVAQAIKAFEQLASDYPGTWIDRAARKQLAGLNSAGGAEDPQDETARPISDENAAADKQTANGIANQYLHDAGIDKNRSVLFTENFESGNLERWDEKRGTIATTQQQPNSGFWCAHVPMQRAVNQGGDAIKWFMPGADRVFTRFYVKFSENYQYNHHFVTLLANQTNNRWSAFGKAGLKPNGTYFSTGMEPWFAWGKNRAPGELNLYSYFLDMEPDRKMNKYWGNGFFPPGPTKGVATGPQQVIPKLNAWQCWEFMLQANSHPDLADGKQAMWLDGKLIAEFSNIRWRNDAKLKVNTLWLQHYGFDPGDPTKEYWPDEQSVWFDDIVIATEYIGPIRK